MKRIINVADRVIQKPQHVRITELFAVRAEGGDIAGKSVIEAKQPERRLPGFSRDVGFARHIRNHGCQFCIAVVRVASGNAIGQAVIPSLVILLKDRIKVAAISIGGALEYPGKVAKAPVRPNKADRSPSDSAAN